MRRVANVFGALGYGFLVFSYSLSGAAAWLWVLQSGVLDWLGVSPDAALLSPTAPTPEGGLAASFISPSMQAIAYVLTAVMVVAVIFMMAALPYWIGRGASMILKRVIRWLQQPVTLASLLGAKLLACLVGLSLAGFVGVYNINDASLLIVQIITLTAAAAAFLIQHYIATVSEILAAKDIW